LLDLGKEKKVKSKQRKNGGRENGEERDREAFSRQEKIIKTSSKGHRTYRDRGKAAMC
jgi:hypothetical protein